MDIKITLTDNPKPKPPADKLGFGRYFTDHMFVMDYTEGQGWHDARVIPYAPMSMDPAAMALHYGQAVFEGLKAYRAEDGRILLFRPDNNFARLNRSDERLCIPHIDEDFALAALCELIKVDKDWVPVEPGTSLYIRPFVFATEGMLGVRPSSKYSFVIILSPVGSYYPQGVNPTNIYVEEEYVRAVRGGIGFTKAAANYAISLKSQVKAHEAGYEQVMWLDALDRKYIEEVGAMNVFFKLKDELVTPELSGSILAGVTRDSVMRMAKSWGINVTERRISIFELFEAHEKDVLEEAFGCGTAAVISPIGRFKWSNYVITVADGGIGPLTRRLYDELTGIQYGRIADPFGWVKEVEL